MRWLATLLFMTCIAVQPAGYAHAARDRGPGVTAIAANELVVFEVDDCQICELFRQEILPVYQKSASHRAVPIRFVNLTYADESGMGLVASISVAPTVVLMRNGQEVERITGYTGPENFLQLVGLMMDKPD